tara:strand:- start:1061 stop:1786 length:726 start_codon:yes stop_codon:yes gene_type:complete
MPLPKVVAPTFELQLITGKKIKYRPFLVKEEKVLLIALEGGNDADISSTLKSVLKSCIITRGVDVEKLPSFELEYLFLNIRGKSVGESIELVVTCQDDNTTKVPLKINLSDIKLEVPDEHTDMIKVNDDVTIKMRYPSMQKFLDTNFVGIELDSQNRIDKAFDTVIDCIDTIFTVDEAWAAGDCTKKELLKFIEQLNSNQFSKIEDFFATMPKLQYKGTVHNPNTKKDNKVVIEGLTNFFA